MAYFPLFNITDAAGFTSLANFSPNNWERPVKGDLIVTSFRTDGEVWHARDEGIIEQDKFRMFEAKYFELKLKESE